MQKRLDNIEKYRSIIVDVEKSRKELEMINNADKVNKKILFIGPVYEIIENCLIKKMTIDEINEITKVSKSEILKVKESIEGYFRFL